MSSLTGVTFRPIVNKLYVLFAEDGSILSLEDNNEIFLNGVSQGIFNKHDRINFNVSEGDIFESTGCIVGGGEVGSSHFSYVPEYCKGRILQANILRSNPTEIKIYPFANGNVDILVNGSIQTTQTLSQGVVNTYTNNANGAWRLNSTVPIIAQVRSGSSDPHLMIWGNNTKIGFASNSARVSSLVEENPTTGTMYGGLANNVAFNGNGVNTQSRVHNTTPRNYEDPNSSSHAVSNDGKRIFINSYADSDGSTSSTWLPSTLMYHTVGLPHETEFISFINRSGKPILKYQNNILVGTLTPTKTNGNSLAWYSIRDGIPNNQNNITSGTIYTCEEKMYAVYQPRESSIWASIDDETTLLTSNLNYKYTP